MPPGAPLRSSRAWSGSRTFRLGCVEMDTAIPDGGLCSEATDKITAALAEAEKVFDPVAKDRENPHFKVKYATLDALQTATRKQLAEQGLIITQLIRSNSHGDMLY